jgi:hypothetical protein
MGSTVGVRTGGWRWLLATSLLGSCGSPGWYFEHIPIEAQFHDDGTCAVTIRGVSVGEGLKTERGADYKNSTQWTCEGQSLAFGGGSFLAWVVLPTPTIGGARVGAYQIGHEAVTEAEDSSKVAAADWLGSSNQASAALQGLRDLADSGVYVAGVSGQLTVHRMDSDHFVATLRMVGQRRSGL